MRPLISRAVLLCAAGLFTSPIWADVPLTFEGLDDLQPVNQFYPGVTFTNAIAEIAGFDLNDAEFPPASGVTVAVADGPMSIAFDTPVTDFQGLFTHSDTLSLEFFLNGNPVAEEISAFIDNLAISGDPGTTPNETLSFHSDVGFDHVEFTGGGVYTVDDVSFVTGVSSVPEPGSVALFATAAFLTLFATHRMTRRSKDQTSDGGKA